MRSLATLNISMARKGVSRRKFKQKYSFYAEFSMSISSIDQGVISQQRREAECLSAPIAVHKRSCTRAFEVIKTCGDIKKLTIISRQSVCLHQEYVWTVCQSTARAGILLSPTPAFQAGPRGGPGPPKLTGMMKEMTLLSSEHSL